MKKSNQSLLLAAVVFVTVFNFSSCGKYDEGPSLSLRTKTSRLTGEWEVVRIGDQAFPSDGYSLEMSFDKGGDFEFSYSYDGYGYTSSGTWEFSDNKEDIEINQDNEITEFRILKLTNKELWFENKEGDIEEYRLEKK